MKSYCMFRERMFRLDGEGALGDAYGMAYLWSARVVCYILRVIRKHNVVLLIKPKDVRSMLAKILNAMSNILLALSRSSFL